MAAETHDSTLQQWRRRARRSPRAKINMHVKVWRIVKGEKKLIPGYSRNISQDGIAVFMPADVQVDEQLELQFKLPGSSSEIKVQAIVRGCNKFQYGMEFINVDSAVKQFFGAMVVGRTA